MSYDRPHITKENQDLARSVVNTLQELGVTWRVSHAELAGLLGVSQESLQVVIENPESMFTFTKDEMEILRAIDQLLSIEIHLDLLLPDSSRRVAWIKTPNLAPPFGGLSALEFILRDATVNRMLVINYLWSYGCGDFT